VRMALTEEQKLVYGLNRGTKTCVWP